MDDVIGKIIAWTKLKIRIHLSDPLIYFREGEIWWASIGENIGYEQNGKNDNFERPIVVVRKFGRHTLWAVPLSTKLKKDNSYYYHYYFEGVAYSAILIQLRLLSSKRLIRKIGMFPAEDFQKVKGAIKNFL
jgi:mRNA interferase MazF